MNKDVIYIDVEDDITAIIGKIKASNEKIVALVPPKRVGVLQSAVNLRLLDRMATNSHKKLVIISSNPALLGLTAAAGIPVAKNLQSKPEIAEIAALSIDDADDIIDGAKLPVGELEKTADLVKVKDASVDEAIDTIDIDDTAIDTTALPSKTRRPVDSKKKFGPKIPDFNSFRKRLFFGITGVVLLVAFLIWANLFAPGATIVITAKTNQAPVSTTVTLSGATPTNVEKGTVQSMTQTIKKDMSVKFNATGSQDIGNKATGTVQLTKLSQEDTPVPAGTKLSSSEGFIFLTQSAVTIPASIPCFPTYCAQSVDVDVAAQFGGTQYNGITGSLTGAPSSASAVLDAATSGGTSKIATVVSESDIQKATEALNSLATDDVKKAITAQFKNGEIVINDSYTVERATPVSSPAQGAEATAQATLTSSVTFTISGIAKSDVELFLKESLNKQISGEKNQRIYSTGLDKVVLAGYNKTGDVATVNIAAKGQIGPKIDTESVKQQAKGKKTGEVQAQLTTISGVDDVKVNFTYFWVTTIPNDITKVDVQFKLSNA